MYIVYGRKIAFTTIKASRPVKTTFKLASFSHLEPVVGIKLLASLEPGEGGLLPRLQCLLLPLQQSEHILRV